jgi:hypothetical protein
MKRDLELVPRITRPRRENGCDYGKPREVVARMVDGERLTELHWRPSHRAWQGRGTWGNAPGSLRVVKLPRTHWSLGVELHEGGRLGSKLLASHTIQLALTEHFGAEVAHALAMMKLAGYTLLVTLTPDEEHR